jgi:predicted hydrocarbon binding protein
VAKHGSHFANHQFWINLLIQKLRYEIGTSSQGEKILFGKSQSQQSNISIQAKDLPAVPNQITGLIEDPLLNLRVMVIDTEFYNGLRSKLYSKFDSGASLILYEMGVGYGEIMARNIKQMGANKLEIYSKFINKGKHQGYGEFNVPLLESLISGVRGEAKVYLKDSFFSCAAGRTGKTECWIVAGMIAGAAKVIFGKEMVCTEEKCASKFDLRCEFYLRPERT